MGTVGLSTPFFAPFEIPSPLKLLQDFWSFDLAMDLGTANTLIYQRNKGIILNEPSIVAVDVQTGKAVAVGAAAKEMYGKTARSIRCARPMKDGVIADFEKTAIMITYMLNQVSRRWRFQKPRLVIGVPSGITQVEKRAVMDAALCTGVRQVLLVEESMAAAVGAGLPVHKSIGNMIVDIGGGTTEVAIISMNATLYSHSIRCAGDEMDEAIQRYLLRQFGLEVGIFEAERIKLVIGSALPFGRERHVTTHGRDYTSGMPRQVDVSDAQIRDALGEPISAIISSVLTALEHTSAEIAHDVISRGIYLTGGGALLKGLAERLYNETEIRFRRAQDPLSCVVRGVGSIVENLKERRILCIC